MAMTKMLCSFLLLASVSTQCQPTHRSAPQTSLLFADEGLAATSYADGVLSDVDREKDVPFANKTDSPRLATNRRAIGSSVVAPSSGTDLPHRLLHYEHIDMQSGKRPARGMASGLDRQNSHQHEKRLTKTQPWLTACAGWGRSRYAATCDSPPALNVTLWQNHSAGSSTRHDIPVFFEGIHTSKENQ
jgi:hypothetical protein